MSLGVFFQKKKNVAFVCFLLKKIGLFVFLICVLSLDVVAE